MIFCADWTYGRILAATITPEGSTYLAPWQPFISGRPMPVADMAWGPDGAMYFVTGGRGTQSGLYCVKAEKSAAITVAAATPASASHDAACDQLRLLRRSFERDQHALGAAELTKRMPALLLGLDHSDRFVQDAARVALEHQPIDFWRGEIVKIDSIRAKLAGSLALVRVGEIDDALHACEIRGEERAIGAESVVEPRLFRRVALRGTALEVDAEREEAMRAPDGHGGEELADVPLGVPFAGVGVGPAGNGLGVEVVEDALDHPGVHHEALDFFPLPSPARVGRHPVDKEFLALDGDGRFRGGRSGGGCGGERAHEERSEDDEKSEWA